jgi:hypothetical protein
MNFRKVIIDIEKSKLSYLKLPFLTYKREIRFYLNMSYRLGLKFIVWNVKQGKEIIGYY